MKSVIAPLLASLLLPLTIAVHAAMPVAKTLATPSKDKDPNKGKIVIAVFETSKGTFKARLFTDKAPKTVENFTSLAEGTREWTDPKTGKKVKRPLYDGTIFHRIIAGFMIQGGDPLGNGTGGPGYKFDNEIDPTLRHSKPGILAMANAGPNTNGSQFYVTVEKKEYLDGSYSVFGEVIDDGMKVVEVISKVKTGPMDRPIEPVVLKSVKIERTKASELKS